MVISRAQHFEEPIIKRVIATEGQTLKIDFNTGDVYVDGVLLNEPYIKTPTTNNEGGEVPEVIPEGYVFVMGDNRGNSLDSRSEQIGLIDKRNIIGKAQCIVFPLTESEASVNERGANHSMVSGAYDQNPPKNPNQPEAGGCGGGDY